MSTICGIFSRSACVKTDLKAHGMKMMSMLTNFPHDAADTWGNQEVFFTNTIKHITPECHLEILPRFSHVFNIAITADAIIDNREELFKVFGIPLNEANSIPDSELILRAYDKWKHECPKHLIGDYAFAIWDRNDNSVFCARDHTGKRTLYYYCDNDRFAFCTIIKPLLGLSENAIGLNEEWVADNLATSIPLNQLSTSSTVYKGIHQLPPAHWIRVKNNVMQIHKYWNPLKIKKLKLKSNAEYEEAFRKVFYEAVKCRLRSTNSIGIMLSSGLDSGSIACIAASMLKQEGKTLKSYTSVPIKDYKNCLKAGSLADESGYIQSILKQYDNIEANFSDSSGINSYNSLDRLINLLEFPYKYMQNLFWVDNLTSIAKKDNCSVILGGQYGNYTVSSGNIENFLCSMISKGKVCHALKEVKNYSICNKVDYFRILRYLFLLFIPDRITKIINYLLRRTVKEAKTDNKSIIHPQFAASYNINRKLKKYRLGKYAKKTANIQDMNVFSAEGLTFTQCAEAEVKLSITYGLANRDPTRDKRVIEFCMSLPDEQLVQQGIDRSLIRRAMKGILPDELRLNNKVRGAQSADWIQRLTPHWQAIECEFFEALENRYIKKYIDTELARELFYAQYDGEFEKLSGKIQMISIVIAWKRFVNEIKFINI